MLDPPQPERDGAVVVGHACAESAIDVLVDKISPIKTRRPKPSQNVPGDGDRQEKRDARKPAAVPSSGASRPPA